MSAKRIEELDVIKGIGMVIIITVHLVYRTKAGAADLILRSLGWLFIAVYYMLAGYSYTNGKRTVTQNWLHRLKTLVLPAVSTEAIMLVIGGLYCALFHGYTLTDWLHDVTVTVIRPELGMMISEEWGRGGVLFENLSPSWFVWTLAWTELLFFPLAQISTGKGKARWWITAAALTIVQILLYVFVSPVSWQLQLVPLFTLFMLMGAKLRESGLAEREWKPGTALTALIAAGCFAVHFGLFMLGGDESYYAGKIGLLGWQDVLLTIVQLPVGFVGMYALAKLILKAGAAAKPLKWLGSHTLIFLMCHCFFGMAAADFLHTFIKPGAMWYVENAGLTLTPEIFFKSLAGAVFAAACCTGIGLLDDVFKSKRKQTAAGK